MWERLQPKRERRNASARKKPTPAATVRMSTMSGTAGVCLARTCRSGSATVAMAPMMIHAMTMTGSFFALASCAPTFSPMGIMAISTPRVKNPIPIIRKAAPARNSISGSRGMGVMVIPRINTMQVTGSTDDKDSVIFSFSF